MLTSTLIRNLRSAARFDRLAAATSASTITTIARAYSTQPPPPRPSPKKNHPSPIGFAVISIAAFGAFAYLSRSRHDDPEKHLREKRIPHPNPLIPPRTQEPQ